MSNLFTCYKKKRKAEMLQRTSKHNTCPQSLLLKQKSDIFPFIWTRWSHWNSPALLSFKVSVWGLRLYTCCRCSVGNTDATPEMVESFPYRGWGTATAKWSHLVCLPGQTCSLNSNFPTFEDLSKPNYIKTKWRDKILPLGTQVKVIKITLLALQIQ